MRVLRAVPVDDPRVSRGRTLPQLLRDQARERGESIAIRSKRAGIWRSLSWNEVNRRVRHEQITGWGMRSESFASSEQALEAVRLAKEAGQSDAINQRRPSNY